MQYIPAVLTSTTARLVTPMGGRPTKVALRKTIAAVGTDPLNFISQSVHHHHGSHFTLAEAFTEYGPVGVEVHYLGQSVATIAFDGAKAVVR